MSERMYAIGIDLGGTKIEVGLVGCSGFLYKSLRILTDVQGGASAIEQQIIYAVQELEREVSDPVVGIGIGVAGQVAAKTGFVHFSPNLKWHNIPLQDSLSKSLKKTVVVINDVRAATWGEWLFGAGKGCSDLVCMFIGTGIGGGIVSEGRMLNGCSNTCGEIGHISIDLRGPICTCGNRGCLESFAGGWGIAKRTQGAIRTYGVAGTHLLKLAGGQIENVTAKHLLQGAKDKDPLSELLLEEIKIALISGCVTIINGFNPCRLILGGGVVDGMPELIPIIHAGIRKKALKAATAALQVVSAKLGKDAGVIGGAALVLHSSNL